VGSHLSTWIEAVGGADTALARSAAARERAGILHSILLRRRMLLVADDVRFAQPARLLDAGGPGCALVLTVRRTRIVPAQPGLRVVTVPELAPDERLALLRRHWHALSRADEAIAQEFASVAGGLPQALVILAAHLRHDASGPMRVAAETERLRWHQHRLERGGATDTSVPVTLQAAVALSTEALDTGGFRALGAVALLPPHPNTLSAPAVQAIAGVPEHVPQVLAERRLLEQPEPGRFAIHDAIGSAVALRQDDREATETCIVDFYQQQLTASGTCALAVAAERVNVAAALELAVERALRPDLARVMAATWATNSFSGVLAAARVPRLARWIEKGVQVVLQPSLAKARLEIQALIAAPVLAQALPDMDRDNLEPLAGTPTSSADTRATPPVDPLERVCLVLRTLALQAAESGDLVRAAALESQANALARKIGAPTIEPAARPNQGHLPWFRARPIDGEAAARSAASGANPAGDAPTGPSAARRSP
jgi:hypothetical protein